MCGRYYLDTLPETLLEFFSISGIPSLTRSFNIAPSQTVPIVRQSEQGREATDARWGLIPFWAKDEKIGYRMINARSETVDEKPAFRSAWQKRRCLIPASGFYEWQRREKSNKQPFVICAREQPLLAFGGLWETWRKADTTVLSFTILTTTPNRIVKPIHDRMPVIIDPDHFDRWLCADAADLKDCLAPAPESLLEVYPVSTAVNKPANNGPELLRPLAEGNQ